MFKYLQNMYAKYYDPRYMFLKNCTFSKLARLKQSQNCVIFGVRFERGKVDKTNLPEN